MPRAAEGQLTAKQQLYCYNYIGNGFKIIEAAISAGYSAVSARAMGTALMKNPKVIAFIEALKKEAGLKSMVGYEEKIGKLWKITTLAVPEEAESILEIDAKAAVSAISELNKMQGHHAAEKYIVANPETEQEIERAHEKMEKLKNYQKEY
jgi:phage terminase small subunit